MTIKRRIVTSRQSIAVIAVDAVTYFKDCYLPPATTRVTLTDLQTYYLVAYSRQCLDESNMVTSCACTYLLQNIIQLFVCWRSTESKPCECVIFIVAEDILESLWSIPADCRNSIIGHHHYMCPAEMVSNSFEGLSDADICPGDTHHCVVSGWIFQGGVAAILRKERTIPVWHEISAGYTHCIQRNISSIWTLAVL